MSLFCKTFRFAIQIFECVIFFLIIFLKNQYSIYIFKILYTKHLVPTPLAISFSLLPVIIMLRAGADSLRLIDVEQC